MTLLSLILLRRLFLLRTSTIQINLIALGLASVALSSLLFALSSFIFHLCSFISHKTPSARTRRYEQKSANIFSELRGAEHNPLIIKGIPPPYRTIREVKVFIAGCHSQCVVYDKYSEKYGKNIIGSEKKSELYSLMLLNVILSICF